MAIECTLAVERENGAVGFRVTVENTGSETAELTFSDGQTVEVVVERDGTETWRYSAGQMFTQALRTEQLDPGETIEGTVTWTDPDPGEYTVRAWCCANGVDCAAERALTV